MDLPLIRMDCIGSKSWVFARWISLVWQSHRRRGSGTGTDRWAACGAQRRATDHAGGQRTSGLATHLGFPMAGARLGGLG